MAALSARSACALRKEKPCHGAVITADALAIHPGGWPFILVVD
jgi:hypothetical protein